MMRQFLVTIEILGLISALTSFLVLGCLGSHAFEQQPAVQVLITGSLG